MFYKIFYPFIYILNGSARLILKMFGMQPAKESELYHSEEELKLLIKESHEGGEISENELTHINRAFAFDEMKIKDGYLPLEKVSVIDINSDINETKSYVNNANYTRFPVIKDNPTNIVGYIHSKDLLNDSVTSVQEITHDILKIKLTTKYHQVLEQMKSQQIHIALVEDENQQAIGIITMENILENIVGDIKDEHD